jgi:hypothetical protein
MKSKALVLILIIMIFGAYQNALCSTCNLKATWTMSTEPDVKEYRLYRTDGARTLIGTIPQPNTSYSFTLNFPGSFTGTLTFVLTAVDTSNNESLDSPVASLQIAPISAPKNVKKAR